MALISWFRPSGARLLFAFLITSLGIASAQSQPPIFPTTSFSSLPTGVTTAMATGDFNGDGQPDLVFLSSPPVSPSSSSYGVTVLLNQGAATSPISVSTNSLNCTPGQLVPADINNDKKLDLLLTCGGGYVVVLLGNGDGTFQAPAYYAVPNGNPGSLTTIDLNGDGYLDVALLMYASPAPYPSLAVLLNKGQSAPGTLSNPTTYPVPSYVGSIGAGDFNGDGKQDILLSGFSAGDGSWELTVLYGNGDGSVQTAQTLPGVSNLVGASPFFTADFNHDGFTDVATIFTDPTNVKPPSLQVLLGSSSGQFTLGSSLTLDRSMSSGTFLSAGTTNNGSKINLALVGSNTTILLGDGNGEFTLGSSYTLAGTPAVSEVDSNGRTDLVFVNDGNSNGSPGLVFLPGNGDGTFQGIPAQPIGPYAAVAADLNGDGLSDILSLDRQGNLVTALGRGNGTFSVTSHVTSAPIAEEAAVITGDFNADGKIDAAVIMPGNVSPDSLLYFYLGNGDGTFQPAGSPINLQVAGAAHAVVGDFNGDGKLDLVISCDGLYRNQNTDYALVFLPGKGDGTFGTPVPSAPQSSLGSSAVLLSADLNNDGKLDLIWNTANNNTVFLGNGDGTFQQRPLGLAGTPLAIEDLNADGIADLVIGNSVYAGNGDGTFQTSPFFTATLLQYSQVAGVVIGDVNADGQVDLLFHYTLAGGGGNLAVYFGDGKGNFTADSNTYYTGNLTSPNPSGDVLARLNNQAPGLANDKTLDFLSFYGSNATHLLNQLNPAPTAPSPVPSKTTLTSSLPNPVATQPLTLTATVTGVNPTGTVTFLSGSTALGSASLVNGVASLAVSFPSASTYSVIATYAGDPNNAPSTSNAISLPVAIASTTNLSVSANNANENQQLSLTATITGSNPTGTVTFTTATSTLGTANVSSGTATLPLAFTAPGTYAITAKYSGDIANLTSTSNTVTVTVAAPDYSVTPSPATATITAGQPATTTLTITPTGGYNGTVKFSCGPLPALANCVFSPASVTPSGSAVSTTLTVTTTATTTSRIESFARPLKSIALALLFILGISPRRTRLLNERLLREGFLAVALVTTLLSLSGCSSSAPKTTIPGTPTGAQTIVVTAADSSGSTSHAVNFQVTIQ